MRFWPCKAKSSQQRASTPAQPNPEEHAVIAYLLPQRGAVDDWSIDDLEEAIQAEIARLGVGELDGNGLDLETGTVELFTYGPDADALASVVNGVLARFPKGPGSYLVKRYGQPGAREERLELL